MIINGCDCFCCKIGVHIYHGRKETTPSVTLHSCLSFMRFAEQYIHSWIKHHSQSTLEFVIDTDNDNPISEGKTGDL